MLATDHSLHFVRGCSHRHRQHLASDFDSTYAHAYTMKHTVGVAVWRGLAVTAKFIQRKLCRQLSAKFKFREIKALYGIRMRHVGGAEIQCVTSSFKLTLTNQRQ